MNGAVRKYLRLDDNEWLTYGEIDCLVTLHFQANTLEPESESVDQGLMATASPLCTGSDGSHILFVCFGRKRLQIRHMQSTYYPVWIAVSRRHGHRIPRTRLEVLTGWLFKQDGEERLGRLHEIVAHES